MYSYTLHIIQYVGDIYATRASTASTAYTHARHHSLTHTKSHTLFVHPYTSTSLQVSVAISEMTRKNISLRQPTLARTFILFVNGSARRVTDIHARSCVDRQITKKK